MRKSARRVGACLVLAFVLALAAFAWTGLEGSWRMPESGTTRQAAAPPSRELTLMAWNLAKCSFHRGGLHFRPAAEVRDQLDRIAEVVRAHDVDLLFLSEVVFENGFRPVNQVTELAERAGFHAWAYGDNYAFGVPLLRIRAGNALLSRFPLRPVSVQQLTGARPFWNPTNNRRLLWADVELGGTWLRVGSMRNDSFDVGNNAAQVRQVLTSLDDRAALLGGDFNAAPSEAPMKLWRASGRFAGVFDGPPTFPASRPRERIDTILIPQGWAKVVEQRVLDVDLSDHEPVLVRLRLTGVGADAPPPGTQGR